MLKSLKKISALCLTGALLSGSCLTYSTYASEVEQGTDDIEYQLGGSLYYSDDNTEEDIQYLRDLEHYQIKYFSDNNKGVTSGEFTYIKYDDGIIITKYNGDKEKVVVPAKLDGKKVIAIGVDTFSWNSTSQKVKSIEIEDGIEYIASDAIASKPVEDIKVPDSVKIMGIDSHCNLENLKNITIGKNVEYFGYLTNSQSLEGINVDKQNPYYTSVDGVLFSKDKSNLIKYPASKSGKTYTVPEGTKYVDDFAFSYNQNLQTINLNSDLIKIGQCTFMDSKLQEVNFAKEGKVQIMTQGFSHCFNLKEINLSGVVALSDSVFYDTTLDKVIINETLNQINDFAFSFCNTDTVFEIYNNKNIIGDGRLGRQPNDNMKLYTVDDVQNTKVQDKQKSVTSKSISESEKKDPVIDTENSKDEQNKVVDEKNRPTYYSDERVDQDIAYANSLEEYTVSKTSSNVDQSSIKESKDGQFNYISHKDGIIVTSYNGSDLDVTIPSEIDGNKVLAIGRRIFGYDDEANKINAVTIEDGIEYILEDAINGNSIEDIQIPDSVKIMGTGNDQRLPKVKNISIGKNVEFVGLITGSTGLENINVDKENPYYTSVDGVLFSKDKTSLIKYPASKKGKSYTVPEGTKFIDDFAFACNRNLESVNFNSDLVRIAQCVFSDSNIQSANFSKEGNVKLMTQVFSHCHSLKEINLSGVSELADDVFFDTTLDKVIINESLQKIQDFAFGYCNSEAKFEIHNNKDIIGDGRLGRQPNEDMKLYTDDDVIMDNESKKPDTIENSADKKEDTKESEVKEEETKNSTSDNIESDSEKIDDKEDVEEKEENVEDKEKETDSTDKKDVVMNNDTDSSIEAASAKNKNGVSNNTADANAIASLMAISLVAGGSAVFFKRRTNR